jgi:hypothetical protein
MHGIGMLGGALNEELYTRLNGRNPSEQELAESMAVGAVFGFAGGIGEYGVSEGSGGLGFGRGFGKAADGVFNMILGGLAGSSGTVLGL